ncbi:PE-PPE domain-containing protein [Mycolicibacterium sp. 018/SC-01/001]|uniref:PE-PPE domain-containing protein n=1 Tax=Mycolicibacterium sp. 018/SC-01/001 TaxID=2592069 RepID=UPI00163D5F92|nr:PE-PPE domain-containing protein [Mycolicibacterium sp. 018/SC-01/001]
MAAAAAVLPVGASTLGAAPAAADELPDPFTMVTLALYPGLNSDNHGGIMCTGTRTCTKVDYPYLDRYTGAADLNAALAAADLTQPLVVFGYSQGARVVSQWLDDHAGKDGAPTPQQVSFVLIGNPENKHGGTHRRLGSVTPDTDFQIIDVTRQYDRASDWPDQPLNLLAFLNANAGLTGIHTHYEDVDIYDPRNYVWKEGNTIYVFVPTENIPLLDPLREMGLDKLADELNEPLKKIIEKAYDRSYLPASPGWPPDLAPPVVTPPAAEPEPQARTATPLATALTTARAARKAAAAEPADVDEPVVATGSTTSAADVAESIDVAEPDDPGALDTTSPVGEAKTSTATTSADRHATRKRPFARLFERHTRASATRSDTPSGSSSGSSDGAAGQD